MPTCIKCKTYNNAGNVHCKKCKSILPVEGEKYCPNCASVNGPFAKVCKSCGLNLKMNNVVKLHGNRPPNSDKTAYSTNYTKLSTYKRKRFKKRVKMFFHPQSNLVTKVIVIVLLLLFVIGVVASF
ncbi:MAG: zinc ribbon domain-containing protein [Lysinibacillus sp.]